MNNPFNGSRTKITKIINQKRLGILEYIERYGAEVEDYNEYYTLLTNGVLIRHDVSNGKAFYDPTATEQ